MIITSDMHDVAMRMACEPWHMSHPAHSACARRIAGHETTALPFSSRLVDHRFFAGSYSAASRIGSDLPAAQRRRHQYGYGGRSHEGALPVPHHPLQKLLHSPSAHFFQRHSSHLRKTRRWNDPEMELFQ